MNKEDYMRLPKERLAELLAEKDAEKKIPSYPPPIGVPTQDLDCFHGGPCINPFHDCVNCPHLDSTRLQYKYTTSTGLTKDK